MTYGPWHRWFAWYPVRTRQHGWRWLRAVERALHYPPDIPCAPDPYWVYRPTPQQPTRNGARMSKTIAEQIGLLNFPTGLSGQAMLAVKLGLKEHQLRDGLHHPHDPADLNLSLIHISEPTRRA